MSGSSPFSVDYASVQAAAQDVRCVRGEVQADLKALLAVVNDLTSSGWHGRASVTYQQVMVRWDTDAGGLLEALDRIADLLVKSANAHQTREDERSSGLATYHNALGG